MRTTLITSLAVLASGLVLAGPAAAFKPVPYPFEGANPHAVDACGNVIDRHSKTAGGGPKAAITDAGGPANCDHFWQAIGVIGGQE